MGTQPAAYIAKAAGEVVAERRRNEDVDRIVEEQNLRASSRDGSLQERSTPQRKGDVRELREDGCRLVSAKRERRPAVALIEHHGGRVGRRKVVGCPPLSLGPFRRRRDEQ